MKKFFTVLLGSLFCLAVRVDAGVEQDKFNMLAKLFSNKKIQNQIFSQGFEFCSMHFIEADDGGTEPVYSLVTCKSSGENKCYLVEFDTDESSKLPNVFEQTSEEKKVCLGEE